MSLINEALKRAETEKLRKTLLGDKLLVLPSMGKRQRPRATSPVGIILICLTILAGILGGWNVLRSLRSGPPTQAARSVSTDELDALAAQQANAQSRTPVTSEATLGLSNPLGTTSHQMPPPAKTQKASGEKARDRSAKETKIARSAASNAAPPKANFNPSGFKVSGIMTGPDGAIAIVNSQFVKAGDVIDGATVVSIQTHAVQLEYDGKSFTIRM